MEALKRYYLAVILFCIADVSMASGLWDFGQKRDDVSLQVILGDEKKTELEVIKKELIALEDQQKHFVLEINPVAEETKTQVAIAEAELKRAGKTDPFFSKKVLILQSLTQVFTTMQATITACVSFKKQHIVLIEDYLKDPEFSLLKPERKSYYSFDDWQELTNVIALQEEKLSSVESEKKEVQIELASRKKKAQKAESDYKDLIQKQTDFSVTMIVGEEQPQGMTPRQQGQLLDIQVRHARYEKELCELRVSEAEIQKSFVASKVEIENKKLQILKKKQDLFIKMSLRIDEKDVEKAQRDKDSEHQLYIAKSNKLIEAINELTQAQTEMSAQIKQLEETFGVNAAVAEWAIKPTTLHGYYAAGVVGMKKEHYTSLERHMELLRAESDNAKIKFLKKDITDRIIQLWYAMKHQQFESHEDVTLKIKRCEELLAELRQEQSLFEDKRKVITSKLSGQNKSLANVSDLYEKLLRYKQTSFGNDEQKYQETLYLFQTARDFLIKENEETSRLIELYSEMVGSLQHTIRQMNAIIVELQRVSLWHRSGRAISFNGIMHIWPDIKTFIADVKTCGDAYVSGLLVKSLKATVLGYVKHPLSLALLLAQIIAVILLFFFLRNNMPLMSRWLMTVSREFTSTYMLSYFFAMILSFLYKHLHSFFIWACCFAYLFIFSQYEVYLAILFFLGSIVYLLFLSRRFVEYITIFNTENDEIFFSHSVQSRFLSFVRWSLYTTVTMLPFREAFVLATYTKSELPDIILATYAIIIRVLLLSLLRKEDVLHFIPTKTPVWTIVWRFIDNYYYVLLGFFIFLMIMMDPHIGGYNNLISYLVWGIVGTVLTLKILYELYLFLRRSSTLIFFSSDGESLKERFQLSKTVYGITVIVLFIAFLLIAVLIISRLWQKPVTWSMIADFFTTGRLGIKLEDQYRKLSILELLGTLSFIPMGLFAGFVVDRFILHRIFSVLLVSPGVHNAISTITYYLVIIAVITIGLWSQGFGFVIAFYLTPILLAMMWSLRDVMGDFVAYFVILIQRPIKVGDFIKLDNEIFGVVRSITPRAVVLRKQQSFVQIVPNSRVLRDTIYNWDYYLNYTGFPDIMVSVGYDCNPDQVKAMLLTAVESTPGVLRTPAPVVRLEEFGDSGYSFLIRGFIGPEKTLDQWNIASEARLSIVRILKHNNICISAPIRLIKVSDAKL